MFKGQVCSLCHGNKIIGNPPYSQRCPLCEGSGTEFDPGLFFEYEMGPFTIPGGGVLPIQSVQILDRSFRWMFAVAQSTGAFTCQIFDSRNKRPFMNQEVHSLNLFGTGQNPMPLLTPFVFEKRGSILATFSDLTGAPNAVRLGFIGVELNDQDENTG